MHERGHVVYSVVYALALSVVVAVGSLSALAPRPGAPVAAVFAPGTPFGQALAAAEAAGARVAGFAGVGWVVVVAPPDDRGRAALARAGAWLLLDAARLAALCGLGADGQDPPPGTNRAGG